MNLRDYFDLDEIESSNVFRVEDNIIYKLPNNSLITYNVKIKSWDNPNYKELIPTEDLLHFCQPKTYVFRGSYLGYYLNTYRVLQMSSNDLSFLYPEYEFIVEQAIKLNIPFILTSFRSNSTEFLRNDNKTSLVKATELSTKQLSIFQDKIQYLTNGAMFYFNRLTRLVPTFKGIQPELFSRICEIALSDKVTNQDLDLYYNLFLSKKGNLSKNIEKVIGYITNNYIEYRKLWENIKELGRLDESLYPEFPKAEELSTLIPDITVRLETYKDEKLYNKLNEQYKEFVDSLQQYTFSNEKYSIIVPQVVQELDIEGNVLHHCVGTYKQNIASGKEIILFLRKNSDLKTPYYTIDLDTDGFIRQIHTKNNGDIAADKDRDSIMEFLDKWGKEKSNLINQKSIKLNYGALCAKE